MIMQKKTTKGNSNQVGIIVDEVSSHAIHIQLSNEVIIAGDTAAITTVTLVVKQLGIDSCSDVGCYLLQQRHYNGIAVSSVVLSVDKTTTDSSVGQREKERERE